MSDIIIIKRNLAAFLDGASRTTTLEEWGAFFKEAEKYFCSENIEEVYENYKSEKRNSIVSRCHVVLSSFCKESNRLPKNMADNEDFTKALDDMRKKVGGLSAMLLNQKDDEVVERLDYLKDKSRALFEFIKPLITTALLVTMLAPIKNRGNVPRVSNAKQVDINTILLPPDLVMTNIN